METTTPTAQDQFVEDFLLVVENDRESYDEIQQTKALYNGATHLIASSIQEQFEDYIAELVEREASAGREAGSLLIAQLLLNWGEDTFYKIAQRLED